MNNNGLSDIELRRFQEQINLSEIALQGQQKIRNARVVVVGAGGTGAAVLQYLSAAGIGFIGIVDFAMVDETNIQRQSLYGGTDLGKLKTIISKQRLHDIFPLSEYEIINLQLTTANATQVLSTYDIIIDATNNLSSSELINSTCCTLRKPMVHCNIHKTQIKLTVFDYTKEHKLQNTPNSQSITQNCGTSTSYNFAGAFAATETIKLLTNSVDTLNGKILTFDCFKYTIAIDTID
jgi:adenylyltransferase/sulfurtransferase